MIRTIIRCLVLLLALSAMPAAAQVRPDTTTDPRLSARGLNAADVIARLRASGMTRAQVRAALSARGYDPSLADPYFDILEREPRNTRRTTGIIADTSATDTARIAEPIDDLELLFGLSDEDLVREGQLPVFGASVFRRGALLDEPSMGPVDPNYRVGPGDEIQLILTGAVQDVYPLQVTREGTLVVPDAGEVRVNGLTVSAVENLLRSRLANAYSSGLTNVSVALGRVRSLQVYVIGDVERPGPYQVSATGTVLNALYRAGGPSRTGSFREVEVRRGNTLVGTIDLYDYLLRGVNSSDIRLQHGDVIFVPPVARRVTIEGAVKRPALYELREGDGLRDALAMAGGPEAQASLGRVQIDRILPPAQRTPGVERVLIDVDPTQLDVPLRDGDEVHVYSVSEERRNIVTITGEVRKPGVYAWNANTTLGDVLSRASGVTEGAWLDRAHVYRLDPQTGARALFATAVNANVALADRDSIVVFHRDAMRPRAWVSVNGAVRVPGRYLLPEGATVNDMILAAGGFADGANQSEAYVGRRVANGDTVARGERVPLNGEPFVLQHLDEVTVHMQPSVEGLGSVFVMGEVQRPGRYSLETAQDDAFKLIAAAGGVTPLARREGISIHRGGTPVNIRRTLEGVALQANDTVKVPRYESTITVWGAVVHNWSKVPYRPGMDMHDVLEAAGGVAPNGAANRATVTYQNGRRLRVQNRFLLPDDQPPVEPGATIFVPERSPNEGASRTALIGQAIAAVSAIATLIIAVNQSQ